MYTKQTMKNGIQKGCFSRDLRRCMCAALAFFCAFCFCLNPLKVSAVATETVIFSSILAAFLAACGVDFLANGITQSQASDGVMTKWDAFNNALPEPFVIADLLLDVIVRNGIINLTDKIKSAFIDFSSGLEKTNQVLYTGTSYGDIPANLLPAYPSSITYDQYEELWKNAILYDAGQDYVFGGKNFQVTSNLTSIYYDNISYQISGHYQTEFKDTSLPKDSGKYIIAIAPGVQNHLYIIHKASGRISISYYVGYFNVESEISIAEINMNCSDIDIENADNIVALQVDGSTANTLSEVSDTILQEITNNTLIVSDSEPADPSIPVLEDYDFSALGQLLQHKFPFSIPHDIQLAAQMLHYQSEAPIWTFNPLDIQGLPETVAETEVTIDLSDDKYTPLLSILRWGIVILYVAGLASISKDMIFD